VSVARRSIVFATFSGSATRSLLTSAAASMAAMPAVAEHVHGDEGYGDEYPNPISDNHSMARSFICYNCCKRSAAQAIDLAALSERPVFPST
jgi:hypothetical protein